MITHLRYPKGYQFFDGNGLPLALGKLFYFTAGTTAAQDTFSDAAGAVPNTNPVLLDGSGRLGSDIYLGAAGDYKEVLQEAGGATVSPWPDDNIPRAAANATNAAPEFTGASSSAIGTHGLVPAPSAGDQAKFLRGDATWATASSGSGGSATDITVSRSSTKVTVASSTGASADIPAADTSNAGVMTAADRAALSGLGTASTKNAASSGNAASGEVVIGSDTRLTNARTPSAHASSHGSTGADAISIAASQVFGISAALASQNLDNVARVGIGTADSGNALSVSGASSLFANGAGSVRVNYSKHASGDTASFSFQDNFSTRAEAGLLGSDDFTIQVSPDGSTFKQALVVNAATGAVTFPNSTLGGGGSGGGAVSSFSFRDANLTGFTGAKWEFVQKAGQSNDAFGSVSQAQFPIASGEIVLIRFDFIIALPDFSKCHVGGSAAAFKKVGSTLTAIDQLSGLSGDQTQDFASSTGLDARIKSLTSSTIDFIVIIDSTNSTYNWFSNFRILRMQTNS